MQPYLYRPEYDLITFFPQKELSYEGFVDFYDYLIYDLKKNPLNQFISLEDVDSFTLTYQENQLIPELRKQLKPSKKTIKISILASCKEAQNLVYFYQLFNAYDNYRISCHTDVIRASRYLEVPREFLIYKPNP